MLAVVAVFWTAGTSQGQDALPDAAERFALVIAAVVVIAMLAWALAQTACSKLCHDPATRRAALRRYRRARKLHLVLLLLFFAWALYGLEWARLVRVNWGLERAVLLDELAILAPLLVPLALSWAAFYEVDLAVRRLVAQISGRRLPLWSRLQYVDHHFRHSLGLVLVPVLFICAVIDLLSLHFLSAEAETAGAMLALGAIVCGFPVLLRLLWKAKPLPPGRLRHRLERISRRAGFRARDILVWDTRDTVANAAVVGFFAPLRYVMLSDGLVKHFSESQIEAVFGHEIGHIKHRHVPLRLVCLLPLCALASLVPDEMLPHWQQWNGWLPLAACQLAVLGAYLIVVFGYFSRRLERQADLFACRVNSCGQPDCSAHAEPEAPDAIPELPLVLCPMSIRTFTGMLEKLADFNGMSRNAPSWQHFSIARRIGFLESLLGNPAGEAQFQRTLRRTHAALLVTIAVAFACVGWSFLN
jgi:STE24 endopeptidase